MFRRGLGLACGLGLPLEPQGADRACDLHGYELRLMALLRRPAVLRRDLLLARVAEFLNQRDQGRRPVDLDLIRRALPDQV